MRISGDTILLALVKYSVATFRIPAEEEEKAAVVWTVENVLSTIPRTIVHCTEQNDRPNRTGP